jgi:ribonucleoside-diphosphate reductase alpha chain
MDYIFRWLQLRFLSGQQLSLFAGLAPATPANVIPSGTAEGSGVEGPAASNILSPEQHASTRGMGATSAPQGGILPEIGAGSLNATPYASMEDRGIHHAADAMRGMYEMGDAPSCHTCGAIMVRNGSCYRCMSCGSTSGCS